MMNKEGFVQLKDVQLELLPGQRILKADDYMQVIKADQALKNSRAKARALSKSSKQAYEDEKQRGYQDGLELAKTEQMEQWVATVARSVDYLKSLEADVVNIVIAAVSKIIGEMDSTTKLRRVTKKMLQSLNDKQQLLLKVNPHDKTTTEQALAEELPNWPNLQIVADEQLPVGALLLETPTGTLDGTLERQLAALKTSLNKVFSDEQPPPLVDEMQMAEDGGSED